MRFASCRLGDSHNLLHLSLCTPNQPQPAALVLVCVDVLLFDALEAVFLGFASCWSAPLADHSYKGVTQEQIHALKCGGMSCAATGAVTELNVGPMAGAAMRTTDKPAPRAYVKHAPDSVP